MTTKALTVTRTPPPDIKLRRAELRLKKRDLKHKQVLDYLDRAIDVSKPILTSPVVMFLGGYLAVNYFANKAAEEIDRPGGPGWPAKVNLNIESAAIKGALTAAFVGNAFGGPSGVAKIIQSLK